MNFNTTIKASSFAGMDSIKTMMGSTSEIERESEALSVNIETLTMRIRTLDQRLLPVLANTGSGSNGGGESAQLSPMSPLGSELRAHSDRVETLTGMLDELLSRLVLA